MPVWQRFKSEFVKLKGCSSTGIRILEPFKCKIGIYIDCSYVFLRHAPRSFSAVSVSPWCCACCCSAVTRPCTAAVVGVGDDDVEKLVPGAAADIDDQDSRTDCSMLVLQVDNTGRHHQHLTRKRECSRLSPTTPRSIHAVALSQREIKVLCYSFVSQSWTFARLISFVFVFNKVWNWT